MSEGFDALWSTSSWIHVSSESSANPAAFGSPSAKALAQGKITRNSENWCGPLGNSGLVGLVFIFGYLWHKGTLLESFGGKNVLAPWCLEYSSWDDIGTTQPGCAMWQMARTWKWETGTGHGMWCSCRARVARMTFTPAGLHSSTTCSRWLNLSLYCQVLWCVVGDDGSFGKQSQIIHLAGCQAFASNDCQQRGRSALLGGDLRDTKFHTGWRDEKRWSPLWFLFPKARTSTSLVARRLGSTRS